MYLVFPRWALGVNFHPRGMSPGPPAGARGQLRIGKIAELRLESGYLGVLGAVFLFSFLRRPVYGGFAYLLAPRLVLIGR